MRLSTVSKKIRIEPCSDAGSLRLPPHEVHIWWVGLDADGPTLCACWDLLSPEETKRASSYRFLKDLREFVVTRAVLRQILARYTRRSAADIRFDSNANGKPGLEGAENLHFNVSHISGLSVFAVARVRIGIDVEHVRPEAFWQTVIRDCLSPRECAFLEALSANARSRAFHRFWTKKEAVLKALGTGLLYPAQKVIVLPEAQKASTVNLLGRQWIVRTVRTPKRYVAAAAVEASEVKLKWRYWRLPLSSLLWYSRLPVNDLPHVPAA